MSSARIVLIAFATIAWNAQAQDTVDLTALLGFIDKGQLQENSTIDLKHSPGTYPGTIQELSESRSGMFRSFSYDPLSKTIAFIMTRGFKISAGNHKRHLMELHREYESQRSDPALQAWFRQHEASASQQIIDGNHLVVLKWLGNNKLKVLKVEDLTPPLKSMSLGPEEVEWIGNGWLRIQGSAFQGLDLDHGVPFAKNAWFGNAFSFFNVETGQHQNFVLPKALGAKDVRTISALTDELYEISLTDPVSQGEMSTLVRFDPRTNTSALIGPPPWSSEHRVGRVVQRWVDLGNKGVFFEFRLFDANRDQKWTTEWYRLKDSTLTRIPFAAEFARQTHGATFHLKIPATKIGSVPSPQASESDLIKMSQTKLILWIGSYDGSESDDNPITPRGESLRVTLQRPQ